MKYLMHNEYDQSTLKFRELLSNVNGMMYGVYETTAFIFVMMYGWVDILMDKLMVSQKKSHVFFLK